MRGLARRTMTCGRLLLLLAGSVTGFLLQGCENMSTVATGVAAVDPWNVFHPEEANLRESGYAAADYMISRAGAFVKRGDVIKVRPLLDPSEPRLITTFAKQIPEQVGARLAQLGYTVDLTEVNTGVTPHYSSMPTPAPAQGVAAADFILSGTYARKGSSDVAVALKLVDALSGTERATHEFILPRTGEIRRNSKTEPVIFRAGSSPDPAPVDSITGY